MNSRFPRRGFLKSVGAATVAGVAGEVLTAQRLSCAGEAGEKQAPTQIQGTYATQAKGIRILPGKWRPHYPWEHIAWVSPPWPCQDYIWLDFPEAIFTNQGLLYLSHVNPPIPTVFHDLPEVPWQETMEGVRFERELPNGVSFGGSVNRGKDSTVDLELHLKNGTSEPLKNITLQTCAFLRAIKEFSDYTRCNKYIHVPHSGWISMEQARNYVEGKEKYRVGWRTRGNPIADLPIALTQSNEAERFVGMTWFENTLSMVSNPNHPCFHADPQFEELGPGNEASIHGKLIFYEGPLDRFDLSRYIES